MNSFLKRVASRVFRNVVDDELLLSFGKKYISLSNEKVIKLFKVIGKNPTFNYPFIVKNPNLISIGDNFYSLYNLRLEAWDEYEGVNFQPVISIGNNVVMNSDCHIGCINRVTIGDNVMMASRVYISDHFHGNISSEDIIKTPAKRKLFSKGPIAIGSGVWIGEGVCIMPGVTIGNNAIIGANAVVTKDIPANAVAAGIPARVLKILLVS